jgi:hypothetical protein
LLGGKSKAFSVDAHLILQNSAGSEKMTDWLPAILTAVPEKLTTMPEIGFGTVFEVPACPVSRTLIPKPKSNR